MKCHRLNEVLELLKPYWNQNPELNLVEVLAKIAEETGLNKPISELTDDTIIYHLKVSPLGQDAIIPGIKKDYEEDFKTALLKSRGVIK